MINLFENKLQLLKQIFKKEIDLNNNLQNPKYLIYLINFIIKKYIYIKLIIKILNKYNDLIIKFGLVITFTFIIIFLKSFHYCLSYITLLFLFIFFLY